MGDFTEDYMLSAKMEEAFEWRKWLDEIPYLKFPSDWEVKAVPPFGGAVIRYYVKRGDNMVSIYLDCYDRLGFVGEPYWEVYPYDDDVWRCNMNETDKLLEAIETSLQQREIPPEPLKKWGEEMSKTLRLYFPELNDNQWKMLEQKILEVVGSEKTRKHNTPRQHKKKYRQNSCITHNFKDFRCTECGGIQATYENTLSDKDLGYNLAKKEIRTHIKELFEEDNK